MSTFMNGPYCNLNSNLNKIEPISGSLEINGNLKISGILSGDNINIITSVGENSIKQKGNGNSENFGLNSASLGDFNSSNGDYSMTLGNTNTAGSKSYRYSKINNLNYLLILDDVVVHDFMTGNTKQYLVNTTLSTGTTTVTSTTNTSQSEIISYSGNCTDYLIINNPGVAGFQLIINYVDCDGVARTYTFPPYNPFAQGGCNTCQVYSHINFIVGNNLIPQNQLPATPITTVTMPNYNIPDQRFDTGFPALPSFNEYFQLECTGSINFLTTGVYEFRLCSDDGSIFRIPSLTYVLNNDGQHGFQCVTSTLNVVTPGSYPYTMSYYQGPRWRMGLTLEWLTPGSSTWEIVPISVFNDCLTPYTGDSVVLCSRVTPTYTIPPAFTANTATIENGITITGTGDCCPYILRTTATTITNINTTTTGYNPIGVSNCSTYEFINNSGGSIRVNYTSCIGRVSKSFIHTFPNQYNNKKFSICSSTLPTFRVPVGGFDSVSMKRRGACCSLVELINYTNAPITWTTIDCCTGDQVSKVISSGYGWQFRTLIAPNFNDPNVRWRECDVNSIFTECWFCESRAKYIYTSTTNTTISAVTITATCTDIVSVNTGDCVTYRFENFNTVTPSGDNVFWTDCMGVERQFFLDGYRSYYDVCAIENSAFSTVNGITVTQIYSGCCVYNSQVTLEVIHHFSGITTSSNSFMWDGMNPIGDLLSVNGNLYGTTFNGGPTNILFQTGQGTIFSCDTNGNNYKILHTCYSSPPDGFNPYAGLIMGSDGLLYGLHDVYIPSVSYPFIESNIFSINLATGQFTNLSTIGQNVFRARPKLMERSTEPGYLYGITYSSAIDHSFSFGSYVCPIIYKYDIALNTTTTLYDLFNAYPPVLNGGNAQMIVNNSYTQLYELNNDPGALYGTTELGGMFAQYVTAGQDLGGVIFRYDISSNNTTIVHHFNHPIDGSNPSFFSWAEKNGTLYGTTNFGGTYSAGTLFSYHPVNGFTKIFDFPGGTSVASPKSLMFGSDGKIYGNAGGGDTGNLSLSSGPNGTIFSYDLDNGVYTLLHRFLGSPNEPRYSVSTLVEINGCLYGNSIEGGQFYNSGTLFKLCLPECVDQLTNTTIKIQSNGSTFESKNIVEANGIVTDDVDNKTYVEILTVTSGRTSSEGVFDIDGIVITGMPANMNYTLLGIDSFENIIPNTGFVGSLYFGENSNALGLNTQSKGNNSFSQNVSTLAEGDASHAEGVDTKSLGYASHSEGIETIAKGTASHAMGINAITNNTGEFAMSNGISQYSMLLVNGYTTGNTSSELFVDGFTERLILEKNTFMYLTIDATAIITSNTGKDFTGSGFVLRLGPSAVSVGFTGQTMTGLLNNTNIENFEGSYPLITVTVNYVNEDYNEFIFTANGNNVGMTFKWSVGLTIVKNKI